jgi:hypothetical protein
MIQRLRRLVSEHSSIGRRAVVLSGGDEALLQHAGCRATHLTQDRFGSCSTPLPESNRSVIVQLEAARARCADLLIIPTSGRWWVERFPDFASYLTRRYVLRADEPDAGMLWDLRSASPLRDLDDLVTGLRAGPSQPAILDWQREYDIAALLSECNVFTPEQSGSSLPYLDGSVDVVTVSNPAPEVLAEARRVAGTAVAVFSGSTHQPSVDLVWPLEITEWRGTQVSVVVKCALDEVPSSAFLCQLDETRPRDLETEILLPIANGRSLRDSLGDVEVVPCRDDSWGSRLRSAAASASGDVVVVIDSELWPLAGWLPPLVQVLRHRADAGVVTGLLVTPDGRVPIGAAAQNGASGPQSDDPGSVAHSYVRRLDAAPDEPTANCSLTAAVAGARTWSRLHRSTRP